MIFRRLLLLFFLCVAGCFQSIAQRGFDRVEGLPTNEVFDLLVDRKGYVWVGHDMGISRYDGVSFTHFSHPQRSSLSISDIIEDPKGRIWFHNFTGQVFYIEDERMHLVTAYENETEGSFPRMALVGNEIVVSSDRGLFLCDTRTMRTRYESVPGNGQSGTKSIAVIEDKVLAFHINKWYLYQQGKGLHPISFKGDPQMVLQNRNLVLQPQGIGDTALMIANPSGMIYKLVCKGGILNAVETLHVSSFINSVHQLDDITWIHGKETSRALLGNKLVEKMQGLDISDIVIDRQGNTWASSLSKGLLVKENTSKLVRRPLPFVQPEDLVTTVHHGPFGLLAGTKKGWLYWMDSTGKKLFWQYHFPSDAGSINLLHTLSEKQLVVSTSVGTFLLDLNKKNIQPHFSFITKDLVIRNNHALVASAVGLFSFPLYIKKFDTLRRVLVSKDGWNKWWQQLANNKVAATNNQYHWYTSRSRSIALTQDKTLYVSFMNGVQVFEPSGVYYLLVNGQKIYSNSMVALGSKLYISTLNKGLLIKNGEQTKLITTASGLFSNSVVRTKLTGPFLWIMLDRGIQVLDTRTDKIFNNLELPQESGSNVYDVSIAGDTAMMATNNGLYRVVMRPSENYNQLHSELKMVLVNKTDTLAQDKANLRHWQNDIQFHLSVPWYNPVNNLYFKYRLLGAENGTEWYVSQPGERSIRFASLMPGTYTLESYAVVAGFQEKNPVRFQFVIAKPWWRTHLFTLTLMLFIVFFIVVLFQMRMRQVFKLEQVRRAISSDLHDEIGSTISSINIYSELAKSEKNNEPYLTLIQENTREVINKLDDLVWSINPKNDSMEQLVARMRLFAEPVLAGAGIQAHFVVDISAATLELPLPIKRNLYLMFKELINNVVKHSKARSCCIEIALQQNKLNLKVQDDGIGIDPANRTMGRSGMQNLKDRAAQSHAWFEIGPAKQGGTEALLQVAIK